MRKQRGRGWSRGRLAVLALVVLLLLLSQAPSSGQAQANRGALLELVSRIVAQLDLTVQQVVFAVLSATVQDIHVQAKQVLNLSVGRTDPSYDPTVPDLGLDRWDGVGLMDHVRRLNRLLEKVDLPRDYRLTADNIRFFVERGVERLREALRVQKAQGARFQMRQAQAFFSAARGSREDLPAEGGARTLWAALARER